MEITTEITRKDYSDFNNYWHFKKKFKKRIKLVIIAALLIPLIVNIGQPFYLINYISTVIVTGLVFGLSYYLIMAISIKVGSRLPSEKGVILGRRKFIITAEGLLEESEQNKNLQKWTSIRSIEFSDSSIFIFVDNMAAYIIPKRFFKDKSEQDVFVATLDEKIKAAHNNAQHVKQSSQP